MFKVKERVDHVIKWFNYNPPNSSSMKGWGEFDTEFKNNAPIRYYLVNTFPSYFTSLIYRLRHLRSWVRYRIVKYHVINTGLEPGYYEVDELMIHANFKLLKDFVEIQKGWMYYVCHEDELKGMLGWKEKFIPYYQDISFRSPELGLKYLEWEMTLDSEDLPINERNKEQAEVSREIFRLYNWWVNIRPKRVEIETPDFDEQGLFGGCLHEDFDHSSPDWTASKKAYDYQEQQEEEWRKEDENNLISLIKIRNSLWT